MKLSNEFAAIIISASGIVGLLVGVAIGLASIIGYRVRLVNIFKGVGRI